MKGFRSSAHTVNPSRPTLSWVFQSPARIFAFGFGSGLIRPAPGTWGTLAGWLIWAVVLRHMSDGPIAFLLVLAFLYGCWVCHRAGRDLGVSDHGGIVWDEMVAIWLVLWLSPDSLGAQAMAFFLFRGFDIIKPPPIRYFDRRWSNGFGVMWDDLLAAGYTLLVMAILVRLGVAF